MKYLPLKMLAVCILVPPIFYLSSLYMLERQLYGSYLSDVQAVYLGDTRQLYNGRVTLKKAVQKQVESIAASRRYILAGINTEVTVFTKKGALIYPIYFENDEPDGVQRAPLEIAKENFALLKEGLEIKLNLRIDYTSPLSILILLISISFSLGVLLYSYKRSTAHLANAEKTASARIRQLADNARDSENRMRTLQAEKASLGSKLAGLREDLDREKENTRGLEDSMLTELLALEKQIADIHGLQDEKESEIAFLKEQIEHYRNRFQKEEKKQRRGVGTTLKRLTTLYKNCLINDKAVQGFNNLTDDLKIKAEEIIHQLNEDKGQVQIKRKVFGRKIKLPVFEVIFGYRGRLYFRNSQKKKVEILCIGTKHTQGKDIRFLENNN